MRPQKNLILDNCCKSAGRKGSGPKLAVHQLSANKETAEPTAKPQKRFFRTAISILSQILRQRCWTSVSFDLRFSQTQVPMRRTLTVYRARHGQNGSFIHAG